MPLDAIPTTIGVVFLAMLAMVGDIAVAAHVHREKPQSLMDHEIYELHEKSR
jgi:hypothetical protein